MGLRPLGCWDCGFESRQRQGCLSVVSCVSGGGLCVGLINRPEDSYCVVCRSVIEVPRRGGLDSLGMSSHENIHGTINNT